MMTGKTYTLDDWLSLVSKQKTEMSEGARWWLDQIKSKTEQN